MVEMDTVWARDPVEGFVLGRITEILDDGAEVTPINPKFPKRVCTFNDMFQAVETDKDYDDNCKETQKLCLYHSLIL